MEGIKAAFAQAKAENRVPLVAYTTAGFPTNEELVPIMLGMQKGAADVVSPQSLHEEKDSHTPRFAPFSAVAKS